MWKMDIKVKHNKQIVEIYCIFSAKLIYNIKLTYFTHCKYFLLCITIRTVLQTNGFEIFEHKSIIIIHNDLSLLCISESWLYTIDGIIDVKCDITLHRVLMHARWFYRDSITHEIARLANLGIIKTHARQKFSLSSPRMSGTAARWVSFARHLGQPHSRKCTNGAPIPFPPVSVSTSFVDAWKPTTDLFHAGTCNSLRTR